MCTVGRKGWVLVCPPRLHFTDDEYRTPQTNSQYATGVRVGVSTTVPLNDYFTALEAYRWRLVLRSTHVRVEGLNSGSPQQGS